MGIQEFLLLSSLTSLGCQLQVVLHVLLQQLGNVHSHCRWDWAAPIEQRELLMGTANDGSCAFVDAIRERTLLLLLLLVMLALDAGQRLAQLRRGTRPPSAESSRNGVNALHRCRDGAAALLWLLEMASC